LTNLEKANILTVTSQDGQETCSKSNQQTVQCAGNDNTSIGKENAIVMLLLSSERFVEE